VNDLDALLDEAGFRLDAVEPADDPAVATVSRGPLSVRIERVTDASLCSPVRLRIDVSDAVGDAIALPGGSVIEFVETPSPMHVPDGVQEVVVTHADRSDDWVTGRAGMLYRDLLPGRWGGRFIVSHIAVPGGGPIPDFVHYHRVRFQLIFVKEGWVRVVYEDQGDPFVMQRGDCVLQPPEIRHRVLESSPGFEVIEVGCPSVHSTLIDHSLELPTPHVVPDRDFGGQRFVHHVAVDASWGLSRLPGCESRDTGIAAATAGLAAVQVARQARPGRQRQADVVDGHIDRWISADTEFAELVVLGGACAIELRTDGDAMGRHLLAAGDSAAVPGGHEFRLVDMSDDFEVLDIVLPSVASRR
jgi:uncharacterized protein YjlB